MIFAKIHLNKYYPELKYDPVLEITSPELLEVNNPVRPVALVVAGGCYYGAALIEGDPSVVAFMKNGFIGAKLMYTGSLKIKKNQMLYPIPHLELAAAIDYLRKNAKKYYIDPNKITLAGFSAGGHLVASYSLYYKEYAKFLKLNPKNIKPNTISLTYPVIDISTHVGTCQNLIKNDSKLIDKFKIHKHISKDFPPTYIFAGLDDGEVPCKKNALALIEALKQNHITYQSHIFKHARHAIGVADRNTLFNDKERIEYKEVSNCVNESAEFIYKCYKKR